MKKLQTLMCTCCGTSCKGRQWWNQDIGYGLCCNCVDFVGAYHNKSKNKDEMDITYGKDGVNYFSDPKLSQRGDI